METKLINAIRVAYHRPLMSAFVSSDVAVASAEWPDRPVTGSFTRLPAGTAVKKNRLSRPAQP